MEIVGRITKDAAISQLKNEKQVVNFSIAINDYYKPKNSEEGVKVTKYVNCSYWISTKIAERLTKGTLAEVSGRIYVNAYRGADGEAKASLNCHVNTIKIHTFGKQELILFRMIQQRLPGRRKLRMICLFNHSHRYGNMPVLSFINHLKIYNNGAQSKFQ